MSHNSLTSATGAYSAYRSLTVAARTSGEIARSWRRWLRHCPRSSWDHGQSHECPDGQQLTPKAWRRIGERTPKPKAVAVRSRLTGSCRTLAPLHQYGAQDHPRFLADFPPELYQVPVSRSRRSGSGATGASPCWRPCPSKLDSVHGGVDHGTWSVLCHSVSRCGHSRGSNSAIDKDPGAGVIIMRSPEAGAIAGTKASLIVGSGNLVHNLGGLCVGRRVQEPYGWAIPLLSARARS